MTIECEYENDGARITQPGKFEGEPTFAPYYWDLGMQGLSDDDDGEWFGFKLTEKDWEMWPALRGSGRLSLHEDGQGFVWSHIYP